MSDHMVPYFQNDGGNAQINIGVKKFMCCGASEPYDHPHVFLDMGAGSGEGSDAQVVCPYCSTLYKFSADLKPDQSDPENCLFDQSTS